MCMAHRPNAAWPVIAERRDLRFAALVCDAAPRAHGKRCVTGRRDSVATKLERAEARDVADSSIEAI